MGFTNTRVTLKRKTSTGSGSFGKSEIGDYDVWLEGLDVDAQRRVGSITNELSVPRGLFFLFSDIDLTDCYVEVNGEDYPITGFDRFTDRKGNFHHIEAVFSY